MPANRFSGKYGAVNGISTLSNWSVAIANTPYRYAASNTRAGSARSKGIRDWTGSMQYIGSIPTVLPGDTFAFVGYLAPSNDAFGTVGPTKEGTAIIERVVTTWAWDTNEPIMSTIEFAGVTPLADNTGSITDLTTPTIDIPEGVHIKFGAEADTPATVFGTGTEIENTVRATFTLSATNNRVVDSETDGWATRKRGTLDWTLDIVQNDVHIGDGPFDIDDILTLVLPVNDTEYWSLQWGRVLNFSGVTVDINTGAIMQQTINIGMQAHTETNVIGAIRKPGAVADWWPWTT